MGMRFRKSGLYALSGIVVEDGLRDKMLFERDQRDFAGHGGRVWYLAGLNGWCRDRERVRVEIIGFGRRSMSYVNWASQRHTLQTRVSNH